MLIKLYFYTTLFKDKKETFWSFEILNVATVSLSGESITFLPLAQRGLATINAVEAVS